MRSRLSGDLKVGKPQGSRLSAGADLVLADLVRSRLDSVGHYFPEVHA